jgi:hypothetical protein
MSELESVIAAQARESNGGLVVIPDAFTIGHRAEITLLAARYRVPAVYWSRFFAEVGGLLSYGVNPLSEFRRAASYADRRSAHADDCGLMFFGPRLPSGYPPLFASRVAPLLAGHSMLSFAGSSCCRETPREMFCLRS